MKKYYAGYLDKRYEVFATANTPTPQVYPYLFCFGPYATRKQATQVAMYQGYGTEPTQRK